MGPTVTIDPVLLAVIATLITIIGVLILAVAHLHMSEIKRQFQEVKDIIEGIDEETKTLHQRLTKHVEDFHAVKSTTG